MNGEKAVSPDTLFDLKMTRAIRESLPVFVVLFTPINVVYDSNVIPYYAINIFFFLVRFDIFVEVGGTYLSFTLVNTAAFLVLSISAFLAGIASFWMLRRFSHKKMTSKGTLKGIVGVIIILVIYHIILFFGTLSMGYFLVGPIPVPFGPLVAILSRNKIMELSTQIDELEKPSSFQEIQEVP